MVNLSQRSELAPSCLTIRGVTKLGDYPVHGGGFGDIWRGRLDGVDDQLVCLKVVKTYLMSNVEANMKVRLALTRKAPIDLSDFGTRITYVKRLSGDSSSTQTFSLAWGYTTSTIPATRFA